MDKVLLVNHMLVVMGSLSVWLLMREWAWTLRHAPDETTDQIRRGSDR